MLRKKIAMIMVDDRRGKCTLVSYPSHSGQVHKTTVKIVLSEHKILLSISIRYNQI